MRVYIHSLALLVLLSTVTGLGGCSLSLVQLTADRDTYRPGDRAGVELHNGTARRVGYNLCGVSLERKTSRGWVRVRPPRPIICTALLRILRPWGESKSVRSLSRALPAGRYRFSTSVEFPLGSKWRRVHSAAFTVLRGQSAR